MFFNNINLVVECPLSLETDSSCFTLFSVQEPHQLEGVSSHEQKLQFSLGCQVILPPESFVSIRLPFVYGLKVKEKGLVPLNPSEHQPELTARIMQGTALQAICRGSSPE